MYAIMWVTVGTLAVLLTIDMYAGGWGVAVVCGIGTMIFLMLVMLVRQEAQAKVYLQSMATEDLERRFLAGLSNLGYANVSAVRRPDRFHVDIHCTKRNTEYRFRLRLSKTKVITPTLDAFIEAPGNSTRVFAASSGFAKAAIRNSRGMGITLWGPLEIRRALLAKARRRQW